jgi:hypothetical protein
MSWTTGGESLGSRLTRACDGVSVPFFVLGVAWASHVTSVRHTAPCVTYVKPRALPQ